MKKAHYLWLVALIFAPFSFAYATTIYEQLEDDSGEIHLGSVNGFCKDVATFTVSSPTVLDNDFFANGFWRNASGDNGGPVLVIASSTEPECQGGSQLYTFSNLTANILDGTSGTFELDLTTMSGSATLLPSHTYHVLGYVGGFGLGNTLNVFIKTDTAASDYFGFIADEQPISFIATTTRILPPFSPEFLVVESDNDVSFEFRFFHNTAPGNPLYEKLGIEVVNFTNQFTYNTSANEEDIVTSGLIQYISNFTLPTGDAYLWRPYARYGSTYIYGNWIQFSVVEEAIWQSIVPEDVNATSTGAFSFVSNVTDLIASKPPFSWFFQINNALKNAEFNATSTPELTLTASSTVFGTILGGDTEINLLSQDIFETFIPDNIHDIFMTLQLLVFYLAGGMYMMRRTFAFFQPQQ